MPYIYRKIQKENSLNIKSLKQRQNLKRSQKFHNENNDLNHFCLEVFKTSIWNKFAWKQNAPISFVLRNTETQIMSSVVADYSNPVPQYFDKFTSLVTLANINNKGRKDYKPGS